MGINFSQRKQTLNPFNFIAILLGVTFISLFSWQGVAFAETTGQEPSSGVVVVSDDQLLHTDLVLLSLKADFFNHRCRGISVNKNFNEVNRLFITKYSLTANNYIKTYINEDVRAEKTALEIEFKRELNRVGGCAAAIDSGWRSQINDLYRELYQRVERSVWFPV